MMLPKALRASVVGLAAIATLGLAGPARAGFYGSDFDPTHFLGSALFLLSPACETDGIHFQSVGGCSFSLQSFPSVTLKNVDGLGNVTAQTTLNFASNPGKLPDSADMISLAYLSGNVAGVFTGFIGGFQAVDTTDFPGLWYLQFQFVPQFSSVGDNVFADTAEGYGFNDKVLTGATPSVLLYHDCPTYTLHDHTFVYCSKGQLADTATNVVFDRVPEPATLALIVGGLGAGWLTRRRKESV